MKHNGKSQSLREEGNKFYTQRQFFDALLKYNESLCFSEPDNINLGFAYANRSAVYFEMKLFDNCLRNIELARRNFYPEKDKIILKQREDKCNELRSHKNQLSDPWRTFKLTYPPNKKLPFVVDCLEMVTNEKYGRHIVTNRALKVGDIIAIETPFSNILRLETKFHDSSELNIYQRCTNCLKENALELIPCESCCKGKVSNLNCILITSFIFQQCFARASAMTRLLSDTISMNAQSWMNFCNQEVFT